MKKDRHGKAAIFTANEITQIRKAMGSLTQHRAIFEIALLTGERIGAILQLQVNDVYLDARKLQSEITYKANTRKNKDCTRQVSIHPDLANFLRSYTPPLQGYLFPGRDDSHITYNAVYLYWKEIFAKCGLDHRGFSCHSTRRWFITQLVENGTDIATVQDITGHKNTSILLSYVGENKQRRQNAIANIKVAA
ncbi:MAG: site-specific integrase [Cyanobacteria bacterium P01_E01_bin.35]